ncbi:MAG: class I SAM-dependent methyltransferase, partial [Thermoanaerobaculia bacterium]
MKAAGEVREKAKAKSSVKEKPKSYDREYFDRWYRRSASRIEGPAELRRRVALAVAMAERFLERPVSSALDVGCGEGRWRAELLRLRPKLHYQGVEPSPYAVERFGKRRNIVQGSFTDLDGLDLGGPYDLVICADVLHYVETKTLRSGLPELVRLTAGLAYLELLTSAEEVEGDQRALKLRPPSLYQKLFSASGLIGVG